MIEITGRTRPAPVSTGENAVGGLEHVVSDGTQRIIAQYAAALRRQPTPSAFEAADSEKSAGERVFDALAAVKVLTAQVAMHLDRVYRDWLFRQLDSLHEVDEWEVGDEPIRQASFGTFLKATLALRPERRPGLGLSQGGNLIAAWTTGRDRLTIEFLPNDRVIWVLTRYSEEEPERYAGQTPVASLVTGLAPHHPEHWLSHEGRQGQEPT